MKLKSGKRILILTMLGYTLLNYACATLYPYIVPPLNQRILRLDPSAPRLLFHYQLASKCGLFKLRTCYTDKIDYYDLTDPKQRQALIDIGFVMMPRPGL